MLKNKSGKIVNITSIVGHTGNVGQANYAASKAGIIGYSKSLSIEYAKKNININCVSPGFIKSDMTEKIDQKYKDKLIEKIPSGRLGREMMWLIVLHFYHLIFQTILMAKPYMLMVECIWLDNFDNLFKE